MAARDRSRSPRRGTDLTVPAPQDFTGGGGYTPEGLRRVCFQMRFETGELEQYLKDHETVWPQMQQALVDCGWHNYSLFYREDGFAVGYFETDVDFKTACARMDAKEVNARWQAAMSKYTPAKTSPVDAARELKHYCYLGSKRTMKQEHVPAGPPFDAAWKPQEYTGGGGATRAGLRRICFQMGFETGELDQYLKDHEAVWPEMQRALADCGWHNYSLFYREDGFAVGFFETDAENFQAACARMDAKEVNTRWQAAMKRYTPAKTSPIDAAKELTHYFHLGGDRTPASA